MLAYLGAAAYDARRATGRKQIHIAVRLDVSESTVRNFEKGRHWPRNPDAIVQAYADELGINSFDLWAEALRGWEESLPSR